MLFPVVHNISISRFISIGLPGWVDWIFFKSFNNECDFHYVFHCNSLAQIWWFIVHLNCNILQIGLLTNWFYSLKYLWLLLFVAISGGAFIRCFLVWDRLDSGEQPEREEINQKRANYKLATEFFFLEYGAQMVLLVSGSNPWKGRKQVCWL